MGTRVDPKLTDPDVRRSYEEELLVGEATETLGAMLASTNLSQRELARRLGVTEGRVSQILSGSENLTLRSLAALGWGLGLRFRLDPLPLADRRGTPAESDPPAPAWLDRLSSVALPDFQPLKQAESRGITIRPGFTVPRKPVSRKASAIGLKIAA
jgi:transcriptional regulator with XRE-family HTH domain